VLFFAILSCDTVLPSNVNLLFPFDVRLSVTDPATSFPDTYLFVTLDVTVADPPLAVSPEPIEIVGVPYVDTASLVCEIDVEAVACPEL
jgi:hypothetical protein